MCVTSGAWHAVTEHTNDAGCDALCQLKNLFGMQRTQQSPRSDTARGTTEAARRGKNRKAGVRCRERLWLTPEKVYKHLSAGVQPERPWRGRENSLPAQSSAEQEWPLSGEVPGTASGSAGAQKNAPTAQAAGANGQIAEAMCYGFSQRGQARGLMLQAASRVEALSSRSW